ncbi:hypothetical protein OG467_12820 [Streptomyces sp. NBC_01361]|nr:hypothetical protein [Streptomyces sp. NBC_01361]
MVQTAAVTGGPAADPACVRAAHQHHFSRVVVVGACYRHPPGEADGSGFAVAARGVHSDALVQRQEGMADQELRRIHLAFLITIHLERLGTVMQQPQRRQVFGPADPHPGLRCRELLRCNSTCMLHAPTAGAP